MQWPGKIWLFGVFLCVFLSGIQAQELLERRISINFKKGTREQYLDTIKVQGNLRLLYTSRIHPHKNESVSIGNYTVKQLLDSLFNENDVSAIVRDDLLILSPLSKQGDYEGNVIVEGEVFEKRNKPVPFATIYLKGKSKGTISNSEGHFKLIIPLGLISDTLVINSMGFMPVEVPLEQGVSESIKVKLTPAYFPMKDIIIRPEDPDKLVMQSFRAIKENYNNKTSLLTAFFRESSRQNEEYISLTEAVIEINKSSYIKSTNDLIRIVKGRNGTNINQSELVNLVVEGGLYNGLRLDVVKYGSYFYGEKALEDCEFHMLKSVFYNERQTYVIGFDMKENEGYAGFRGKMYVDARTMALVRAEFELSPSGIQYARSLLIKKSPKNYKTRPLYAKYEVEYRHYKGLWNLHYARSELGIKVKKQRGRKNKGFTCNFTSTSEFVVTEQVFNAKSNIRYKQASKPNDVLVKQVQHTQGTYWTEDNIIVPEEPLQNTIKRLQEQGVLLKEQGAGKTVE